MDIMNILYQIVFVLVIIATIMLILVLWKLYLVLVDVNDATKIAKRRVRELDLLLSRFEITVNSITDTMKSFAATLNNLKKFKNKISGFWENDESGES